MPLGLRKKAPAGRQPTCRSCPVKSARRRAERLGERDCFRLEPGPHSGEESLRARGAEGERLHELAQRLALQQLGAGHADEQPAARAERGRREQQLVPGVQPVEGAADAERLVAAQPRPRVGPGAAAIDATLVAAAGGGRERPLGQLLEPNRVQADRAPLCVQLAQQLWCLGGGTQHGVELGEARGGRHTAVGGREEHPHVEPGRAPLRRGLVHRLQPPHRAVGGRAVPIALERDVQPLADEL